MYLGFSTDKAALRDSNYPEHRGGGRKAMFAILLVGIFGGVIFFSIDVGWLPSYIAILTVFVLGPMAGFLFIWRMGAANKRNQARLDQEKRDNIQAERDKQLQEAKDKGDFDKWGHNT
jgi:Flp pilus assembly protein TadB